MLSKLKKILVFHAYLVWIFLHFPFAVYFFLYISFDFTSDLTTALLTYKFMCDLVWNTDLYKLFFNWHLFLVLMGAYHLFQIIPFSIKLSLQKLHVNFIWLFSFQLLKLHHHFYEWLSSPNVFTSIQDTSCPSADHFTSADQYPSLTMSFISKIV
jgi:hypothetical protein